MAGTAVDLGDVPLDEAGLDEFRRAVYAATRGIAPGTTRSYGEIARAIGRPDAARDVGVALSRNRYPIIVPCHRVVAANGALTGFSALAASTRSGRCSSSRARPATASRCCSADRCPTGEVDPYGASAKRGAAAACVQPAGRSADGSSSQPASSACRQPPPIPSGAHGTVTSTPRLRSRIPVVIAASEWNGIEPGGDHDDGHVARHRSHRRGVALVAAHARQITSHGSAATRPVRAGRSISTVVPVVPAFGSAAGHGPGRPTRNRRRRSSRTRPSRRGGSRGTSDGTPACVCGPGVPPTPSWSSRDGSVATAPVVAIAERTALATVAASPPRIAAAYASSGGR